MPRRVVLSLLLPLLLAAPTVAAPQAAPSFLQVEENSFAAATWIARAHDAERVLLSPTQIAERNARSLREDASLHDLARLPGTLAGADIVTRIRALAKRPQTPRVLRDGMPISEAQWQAWENALALDSLPASQPTRFGLITRRAALRSLPTDVGVYSRVGDWDIDRLQESALFPGTPVVIAHSSHDGAWRFVIAPDYAAWIHADAVAEGTRADVLAYANATEALWITGAVERTVATPTLPALSALPLDMGTRVPRLRGDAATVVNGQSAHSAHVVQLPTRDAAGRLQLRPALLPRHADVHSAPLPFTRANVLRQAFKFLGERYGWGHANDARDCSGFVREVYASMGIVLPRNTGDQARSPALQRWNYREADAAARRRALATLQVGDMLHLPGHVMLVIGHDAQGAPWVIHDVHSATQRLADGRLQTIALNGVSVTPLPALHLADGTPYTDRLTTIVRVADTFDLPAPSSHSETF